MFTAIAALWSASTFGVLARLLPGDELLVSGKQTLAGIYVDGFRVLSPVNR